MWRTKSKRIANQYSSDRDPDWIFELKLDGFRALVYIEGHHCRLISRSDHTFKQWPYRKSRSGALDPVGGLVEELARISTPSS